MFEQRSGRRRMGEEKRESRCAAAYRAADCEYRFLPSREAVEHHSQQRLLAVPAACRAAQICGGGDKRSLLLMRIFASFCLERSEHCCGVRHHSERHATRIAHVDDSVMRGREATAQEGEGAVEARL
jgi:hypothetical protein